MATQSMTEIFSPFTYAEDPSGIELRRALLTIPQPRHHPDPASVLVAGAAGATLLAGVARILLA